MKPEIVDYLITNACPSISMRTQEEILKKQMNIEDKQNYISKILLSEKLNLVLSWQNPDGYFGERLHTPPSNSKVWAHEGCVRYLLEMGLNLDYEPLKKSLDVMLIDGWNKECQGIAADVFGYGMIRASLFAQAGLHTYDFVQEWIDTALYSFKCVAEAKDYSEIAVPYRDKYAFLPDRFLPNIYLLRILAFTYSWRNTENVEMLAKAYQKLYDWLPLPPTYIKVKSQLVAPAGNITGAFNQDINESVSVWWFFFYELSARLGMMGKNSPFYPHILALNKYLEGNEGLFIDKYNKRGYDVWSGYSGLMLEENWTKRKYRVYDLTFRSHLINSLVKQ